MKSGQKLTRAGFRKKIWPNPKSVPNFSTHNMAHVIVVSNFLTAHQHIIGYSVPYNGLENAIKDGKYNQGYLATIKYE